MQFLTEHLKAKGNRGDPEPIDDRIRRLSRQQPVQGFYRDEGFQQGLLIAPQGLWPAGSLR